MKLYKLYGPYKMVKELRMKDFSFQGLNQLLSE